MVSRSALPALAAEVSTGSASLLPPPLGSSVPPQQLAPVHPLQSSIDYLRQTEFFRDLLPGELMQVANEMQRVPCSPKEVLCREGEPIARMMLVHSGWVKATKLSASGEEVIVGLSGPGNFVAGLGLRPGAASPLRRCLSRVTRWFGMLINSIHSANASPFFGATLPASSPNA